MFTCILWDNSNNPYTYGPFETAADARAFAIKHYGFRHHIAQHIDPSRDAWDKERDAYLADFEH